MCGEVQIFRPTLLEKDPVSDGPSEFPLPTCKEGYIYWPNYATDYSMHYAKVLQAPQKKRDSESD